MVSGFLNIFQENARLPILALKIKEKIGLKVNFVHLLLHRKYLQIPTTPDAMLRAKGTNVNDTISPLQVPLVKLEKKVK